jgi:Hypervirulence associated proteins TUDOR domain
MLMPLNYSGRELPALQFSAASDRTTVPKSFKIHDRVSWNSEAGRVSGTIIRVHTREFEVKGYTHHASPDDPQYEIKSSKTDHIAFHKAAALTRLGD